jgi:pimeloyl-ACP methyl ester carboxylesterase
MNPFYFGTSERPLFGVYTHGRAGGGGSGCTLMCYPTGAEYMRAHRAFRQLNTLLNRAGVSVLRFDYSCTGDSSGEGAEATVEHWLEDIEIAVEELRDNAMVDEVSVVGLRWGAALAAQACTRLDDVDHLVLWDPVVSGSDYLDSVFGSLRPTSVVGLEGFPLSPELVRGLEAIDLRKGLEALQCARVTLMVSEDRADYRELAGSLDGVPFDFRFEVVPSSGDWAVADPLGDALIPQQIIQAIVGVLQVKAAV